MDKEQNTMKGVDDDRRRIDESEETEALELILFQVSECYVYLEKKQSTALLGISQERSTN